MDRLHDVVFRTRPTLEKLYTEKGNTRLVEYLRPTHSASPQTRVLSDVLRAEIIRVFADRSLADRAVAYLADTQYVSTVDHHGLLSHPAFVQAHIAQAVANKKNGHDVVLVFSSASISLDNHTFPRGVSFHTDDGEIKLPLFSSRERQGTVYGMSSPKSNTLQKTLEDLAWKLPAECASAYARAFDDVRHTTHFSDFCTHANETLFRAFPRMNDTSLIMIPHERISAGMIAASPEMQSYIFHSDFLNAYESSFVDVKGAHSDDAQHGTFLFWYISQKNSIAKRVRLYRDGNFLHTESNSFRVAYTKETILPLLASGELIPCIALSYSLIGAEGVTLGGGFNQVDYLDTIYSADGTVRDVCGFARPLYGKADHMGGDMMYVSVQKDGARFPATFLDLLASVNASEETAFFDTLDTVTLKNAIDGVLPDAYFTDTGTHIDTYDTPIIL